MSLFQNTYIKPSIFSLISFLFAQNATFDDLSVIKLNSLKSGHSKARHLAGFYKKLYKVWEGAAQHTVYPPPKKVFGFLTKVYHETAEIEQ